MGALKHADIGAVESERRIADKVTRETRDLTSSLPGSVSKLAQPVRAHWGIENRPHCTLDMAFGKDDCGIWQDHAPANQATLRKLRVLLQESH